MSTANKHTPNAELTEAFDGEANDRVKKTRKPAATMDNALSIVSKLNLEQKVNLVKELKYQVAIEVKERQESAKDAESLTNGL
jgi:hypothetical protein